MTDDLGVSTVREHERLDVRAILERNDLADEDTVVALIVRGNGSAPEVRRATLEERGAHPSASSAAAKDSSTI